MTEPFYSDNHIKVYNKDCRQMVELPDESVQCVVTSPPYWGLRKYSGEQGLVWGDQECEHQWVGLGDVSDVRKDEVIAGKSRTEERFYGDESRKFNGQHQKHFQDNTCSLCGAWKGSFGLEPTPELYIQHTIEILREIRRVLRKDGVVFWNIGDSYNGSGGEHKHDKGQSGLTNNRDKVGFVPGRNIKSKRLPRGAGRWGGGNNNAPNLKPKDLCLIPFRVAIAAQEDGWWVRSDIIWSKPNPMPESVTDRPTGSHEFILMLTKSGTSQYWTHRDNAGSRVKPKADYRWIKQISKEEVTIEPGDWKKKIKCPDCGATGKVSAHLGLDVWQEKQCPTCNGKKETQLWKRINLWKGHDYYWDADAVREPHMDASVKRWGNGGEDTSFTKFDKVNPQTAVGNLRNASNPLSVGGRNIRSVWDFPTQPYPEAHFAVFPEKLPEICIKAATPEVGCCSKCGAPWERMIEKTGHKNTREPAHVPNNEPTKTDSTGWAPVAVATNNWQPTCKCDADKVLSLVLDPFAGAGTTLWVAKKLNRRAVGYELSEEYCRLIIERNKQQAFSLVSH